MPEDKKKTIGSLATLSSVGRIMASGMKEPEKNVETMDVDEPVESEHNKQILAEFERRRRARTLTLPTDDQQVKLKLRMLNEPICLFGEEIIDRRERLRALLSNMDEGEIAAILHTDRVVKEQEQDNETWYYRGTPALKQARLFIAGYSLRRAKARLEKCRQEAQAGQQERALARQEAHRLAQSFNLYASQVADTRPVPYAEFAKDSQHLVTAGWTGAPTVWRREDCQSVIRYAGHGAQCGCAIFHPDAFVSADKSVLNVVSCSHDGSVYLWSLDKTTPLAELENHGDRVSRVSFHPSGRFLASACFDNSWRLHDVEVGTEILFQTGHSKAVSDVLFQSDGSVLLSTGMDCYGRVWDLRTGRCIMFLDGHTKEVLTGEFHPNAYIMVTGSADNTCKIWDLRMRRCIYTIAAHSNAVSRVKMDSGGQFMVTSSFDCSLKIWSTDGWQPLRHLQGHETKVMGVDVSRDSRWIVSAAFDRTFKLWNPSEY